MRNSPTPWAPRAIAGPHSSGLPILASNATSTPSVVRAGAVASPRSRARGRGVVPRERLEAGALPRVRVDDDLAARAVDRELVPGPAARSASRMPVAPTTAECRRPERGSRRGPLATIARADAQDELPRSVAVSDGARSSATITAAVRSEACAGSPASRRAMRSATSITSVARPRRRSSSRAARRPAIVPATSATAPTASIPLRSTTAAAPSIRSGSRAMAAWAPKIAGLVGVARLADAHGELAQLA